MQNNVTTYDYSEFMYVFMCVMPCAGHRSCCMLNPERMVCRGVVEREQGLVDGKSRK